MTNKAPLTVKCPTCKKTIEWNEQAVFRPFCSERCQQIDLGAWSTEAYAIPSEPIEQWSEDEKQTTQPGYSTIH